MKVVITGAAGFVGRHFTKRLCDLGHFVTGVDNLASESAIGPETWPEHLRCTFNFVKNDCREFFKTNNEPWDLVIHLAAIVGGRANMETDPMAVATDLAIDADFFTWIAKNRATMGHVIYFSSSAAYPVIHQQYNDFKTLDESLINFDSGFIGQPDLTYGWSKLTGEYLAKTAASMYNVKIACFRPFSGYGEDQNDVYPFIGILKRIMKKENPVTIWSDAVRDFIYIDDIVDWVLEVYPTITDGSAINLGTGDGICFSDLAKKMMEITGHDAPIYVVNDKPKGVYYRVSATRKNPATTLDEGIRKAVAFLTSSQAE